MDPYLQQMVLPNPDELSMEQQRAMAQRLRGMQALGALGLTSQVTGAAQGGQNLLNYAQRAGETMGDRQQRAADRGVMLTRALASSARRGSGQAPWRATATERQEMKDLNRAIGTISALEGTFKDEYANEGGLGVMEALVRRGMNREPVLTKAVLKAVGKDTSNLEGEMEWWRQYARLQEIPQLAATYGATLTANEQGKWESAEIYEGQTPEQIRRNLKIRTDLARKWLSEALQFNKNLGFPTENMEAALEEFGGDPGSIGDIMQRNISPATEAAERPSEDNVPDGVSLEEWQSLTPEERSYYMTYMR